MDLNVYWMRHAISCNNIKTKYEKITNVFNLKDPSILLQSMILIVYMRNSLPIKAKNPKMIFTSQMKRAIQTAIINYPNKFINKKIKVIRGINEIKTSALDIGGGNIPQDITILKKELKFTILTFINYITESNNNFLKKYELYVYINNNPNHLDNLINGLFSDIDNKHFSTLIELNEPENNVITALNNYCVEKNINTISIISHSRYLDKFILNFQQHFFKNLTKKKRPYNNQIIYKQYKINKINTIDLIIKQKLYPFGCFYKYNKISCFVADNTKQIFFKKKISLKKRDNMNKNKNKNLILKVKDNFTICNNLQYNIKIKSKKSKKSKKSNKSKKKQKKQQKQKKATKATNI